MTSKVIDTSGLFIEKKRKNTDVSKSSSNNSVHPKAKKKQFRNESNSSNTTLNIDSNSKSSSSCEEDPSNLNRDVIKPSENSVLNNFSLGNQHIGLAPLNNVNQGNRTGLTINTSLQNGGFPNQFIPFIQPHLNTNVFGTIQNYNSPLSFPYPNGQTVPVNFSTTTKHLINQMVVSPKNTQSGQNHTPKGITEKPKSGDVDERETAGIALFDGVLNNVPWAQDRVTELAKSGDVNERDVVYRVIKLDSENNQPWASQLNNELYRLEPVSIQNSVLQNQLILINALQQLVLGNQGIAPMHLQTVSYDVYMQLQAQFRESQAQLFFANQENERLKRELEEARGGKK